MPLEHVKALLEFTRQIAPQERQGVAAALAPTHSSLSRILLGSQMGLQDTVNVRSSLTKVPPLPLPSHLTPPTINAPPRLKEMLIRTVAAKVIGGFNAAPPGRKEADFCRSLTRRFTLAREWALRGGKRLLYAAANRMEAERLRRMVTDNLVEVTTLEEALLTAAASSPVGLQKLAHMLDMALCLDGLHKVELGGLPPLRDLLDDLNTLGQDVLYLGAYPHPFLPEIHWQPERPGSDERTHFTYHAEWATQGDLLSVVTQLPEGSTGLLMLPSRRAALEIHTHVPGSRLLTRTKTRQHLMEEPTLDSGLTVSAWSPTALSNQNYSVLYALPMSLPLLAEACEAADLVEFMPVWELIAKNRATEALQMTAFLVRTGQHPQDDAAHRIYWQSLSAHSMTDTYAIGQNRLQLDYQQVTSGVSALFRSGVTVLVNLPEAAQDVERLRQGWMPYYSRYTVMLSQKSLERAIEQGLVEETSGGPLWIGPYNDVEGVGWP